jgi:hypothetical protein
VPAAETAGGIVQSRALVFLALVATLVCGCGGGGGGPPPPPVVTGIGFSRVVVEGLLQIDGSGFRGGPGEVRVGGIAADVVSWTNTMIVVTVPDLLPGNHDVVVSTAGGNSAPATVTVVLPWAVFIADDMSSVFGFTVSFTGELTPIAGSPYNTGGTAAGFNGDADSIRVHPGTRRVFATNQASIAVWDLHPATAALTPVAGSPFTVAGAQGLCGIAVNGPGTRLFVTDRGLSGVHVLAISAGGALSPIAGSPFSVGAGIFDVPKLSLNGAFLYVNDESVPGSVHVFAVAASGALTPIAGSPFGYPEATSSAFTLEMSPQGRLYVPDAGRAVLRVYDLGIDGAPTENISLRTALGDSSVAFAQAGTQLFAALFAEDHIYMYDSDPGTGALTEMAGSPYIVDGALGLGPIATTGGDVGDLTYLFVIDEPAARLHVFWASTEATLVPIGEPIQLTGTPSGVAFTQD